MRTTLLALALVLLAAAPAAAAEDVLQLKSGKIAVGEIVSLDEKGVTLKGESGEARYDWSALTPLSQYEVRADHIDSGDAKGHFALAEFCLRSGLYPHARKELSTAHGLGYGDRKKLGGLLSAVNEAEADAAFAAISQLKAEEEYERALEEVRRFIIQAPDGDATRKARAMVPDLLRRMDAAMEREEEARKEAEKADKNRALTAKLAKYIADAEAARTAAAASFAEAVRYHQIGNVTRTRKGYQATEAALIHAYRALGRVQRLARAGVAYDKAAGDKVAIKKQLVKVYVGLARLFIDDRNFKSGIIYVNKALFLDPVNDEALDMRGFVDANRLRRRLSGITNTVPGRGK